jgi:hypothetical protein
MSWVPHWTTSAASAAKVLRVEGGGHAKADPPTAVLGLTCKRSARPSEPFRADPIAFQEILAAPRSAGVLVVVSEIAHAQFNGIDAQFVRGLIQR